MDQFDTINVGIWYAYTFLLMPKQMHLDWIEQGQERVEVISCNQMIRNIGNPIKEQDKNKKHNLKVKGDNKTCEMKVNSESLS